MSERWKSVGEDFASLKNAFKGRYDAEEETPDSEDVKNALNTIGEGLERLFGSIGDVVRDDEFKSKAKATMKNLGDAITESVSEIGAKVQRPATSDEAESTEPQPNSPGSESAPDADDDIASLREDLDEDL